MANSLLAQSGSGDTIFIAESVIADIIPYPYGPGTATNAPILIRWEMTFTGQGATTGITLRVRRSGTTGIVTGAIVLGPVTYTVPTVSGVYSISLVGIDTGYDGTGYAFTAAAVGGIAIATVAIGSAQTMAGAF